MQTRTEATMKIIMNFFVQAIQESQETIQLERKELRRITISSSIWSNTHFCSLLETLAAGGARRHKTWWAHFRKPKMILEVLF